MDVSVINYPDRKNLVLRWKDPYTGKLKTKSAGTSNRRKASELAARIERKMKRGITWAAFRIKFTQEHSITLSEKTFNSYNCSFNSYERLCNPRVLSDVTRDSIGKLESRLAADGKATETIKTYVRHIYSALRWAHERRLIDSVPKYVFKSAARTQDTRWESVQ